MDKKIEPRLTIIVLIVPLFLVLFVTFTQSESVFAAELDRAESSALACPSEDFNEFFIVFMDNKNIQHAFTKEPLIVLNIDRNAHPNWIHALEIREKQQVTFPIFPSYQEIKARSLDINIAGVTRSNSHAQVYVKRTGARNNSRNESVFIFEKEVCWKLALVEYYLSNDSAQFIPDEKASPENPSSCPFPDFFSFLAVFMENETLQRTNTISPLITRYISDSNSDSIRIIESMDNKKIKFPIFPYFGKIMGIGSLGVLGLSEQNAEVEIKGYNSGYLMRYLFSRRFNEDACWRLVFIDDHSM